MIINSPIWLIWILTLTRVSRSNALFITQGWDLHTLKWHKKSSNQKNCINPKLYKVFSLTIGGIERVSYLMQYQDVCRTHHIEMPHNKSTLIKLLRARFEKKPTYISYFLKIQLKYNSAFPKHSQIFQHVKLSTVSRSHRTTESKH